KIKSIAMEVHRCRTLEQLKHRLNLDEAEIYAHGLEALIKKALPEGAFVRLMRGPAGRPFASQVNRWRPAWRYDGRDWDTKAAGLFMAAVDEVYRWLEANRC